MNSAKEDNHHHIFFLYAVFLTAVMFFIFSAGNAQAANCGGATVCACGDTVTASTTLTGNLTCAGHGLVVGANNITIDGGNYTITGDGGLYDNGIDSNNGYDNITVKNISVTNFNYGVYFNSSSSSTIQNVTAYSNRFYGIFLLSSNSSTLTTNTVYSNELSGIQIQASSGNTLTNNIMSENGNNLYVYTLGDLSKYNNTIDTTNKVEGKSVYYFYDNDGTAGSPLVYDGDVLGDDIGMFWCIACDYVQIKNATLSTNNPIGVHFFNTSNSVIQNVTTNSNTITGIDISGSGGSSNTLTNNTVSFNNTGIALGGSLNTLTSNTVSSNSNMGISISNFGSSNTLTNNIVLNNGRDINISTDPEFEDPDETQILSSNQFNHNMNTAMLTFTETTRTKNVDDLVNFDISMFNPNGTSCSDCSYAITTSPSETVSSSKSGNQVTGSFTATKSGTYSLIFTITDSNSNTTKRNYLFIIGDTGSQTTKYYFRPPTNPTRGQPKGNDAKALLLTAPDSVEEWACFYWIQGSPDEVPNYPLANLSDINTYSWYKSPTITAGKYIGVQRVVGYDAGMDYSSSVPVAADYTWVNKNFANLNWAMDYFHSWYWISLKLYGASASYWATFPTGETNKSYADFIYQYAATPTVKSISNPNVVVLSATAPANATSSVSIALENPNSTATSTSLTLTGFQRPFLGATSTIYSTATTTITTPSISANATSTFNSVPIDLTPSSGSIDVAIDTWNTTSTYYKKWTEIGDTPAATAAHTIGDLRANQWYQVKVGGSVTNTLQANSSGEIIFTYSGGYSTKTFEVEELPTAPTIGTPAAISSSSIRWNFTDNADNETGFRLYDNTDTLVASSATVNLSYFDETGLSENTQYSGRYVKAYNGNGSSGSSSAAASAYTLADTPTNLAGVSGSDSITLSVDIFPNDTVGSSGYYFANTTNSTNSGWIQANSWENTGLSCGTSYNYTVKYRNGDGTETDTISLTQATSACANGDDLEVFNVEYSSTSNSIVVEWETNNKSDSRVRYGKDRNLDQEKKEDNRTKNHKVTLKNLDPDTLYYFRAKSVDGNGSEDSSDIKSIYTKKKTGALNFTNGFLNSASGGDEPEKEKQEAGSGKDVIEKINEIPEKIQKWSEGLYDTNVFTLNGKKILQEIRFQFKDKNNNPIPNMEVALHSETKKSVTDGEGYAVFNEVETGRHTLAFNYHNRNRKFAVDISDPETKSGEVKIETVVIKVTEKYFDWRIIVAAALAVFILTIFWLKKRKQP